jgi:hypothetical protein
VIHYEKLVEKMADRAMQLHHDKQNPRPFINAVSQALNENGFRDSSQRGIVFSAIAKECRARRDWQDNRKQAAAQAAVLPSPQLSLFA